MTSLPTVISTNTRIQWKQLTTSLRQSQCYICSTFAEQLLNATLRWYFLSSVPVETHGKRYVRAFFGRPGISYLDDTFRVGRSTNREVTEIITLVVGRKKRMKHFSVKCFVVWNRGDQRTWHAMSSSYSAEYKRKNSLTVCSLSGRFLEVTQSRSRLKRCATDVNLDADSEYVS